jgi:hypothetical protein
MDIPKKKGSKKSVISCASVNVGGFEAQNELLNIIHLIFYILI